MKATLTHNNAYDAVIIQNDDGAILCAAQLDGDVYKDFYDPYPDFGDWNFSSPYNLDILDDPEDYGTVYAVRNGDDAEVEAVDEDLFESRAEFWRKV